MDLHTADPRLADGGRFWNALPFEPVPHATTPAAQSWTDGSLALQRLEDVAAHRLDVHGRHDVDVGPGRDAPARVEDAHAARQLAARLDVHHRGVRRDGTRPRRDRHREDVVEVQALDA